MAGNFNQVLLMGNLTRDVELAHTSSNQAVAKFGLAINRYWTSASGEKKEDTTFVDCEAWGKTGENIARFFSKGRPIFVQGSLRLDQWNDKTDGSKRSKLKVVVDNFQFVDSKQGGGGGGGHTDQGDDAPAPRVQTRGTRQPAPAAPEINEEDIPF
ncbi:MAG TPA: single-stranded DNA-binding protein [Phycisphaerales bacterium]|nr:single-stranded DNA-binding protein [Phycisphaerales bacterium]